MKRVLLNTALLISTSVALVSNANAASLIGTDTFSGGTGPAPDIFLNDQSTSFDARDDGTGGVLTITGFAGNVSFSAGTVQDSEGNLLGTTSSVQIVSQQENFNGTSETTGNPFTFTLNVDQNGELLSGSSISIFGEVTDPTQAIPDPSLITPSAGNAGGNVFRSLRSANGTVLNGNLAFGDLTRLGISEGSVAANGNTDFSLDFRFANDPASIFAIAGFGEAGAGIVNLTNLRDASGEIVALEDRFLVDWTATATGFNVIVPVPAAVWLLGSALIGLVGINRKKNI